MGKGSMMLNMYFTFDVICGDKFRQMNQIKNGCCFVSEFTICW